MLLSWDVAIDGGRLFTFGHPTFQEHRIFPFLAFYVTNDIATTFEFPLHNYLAKDPEDTVAVFCFELDLEILHGDLPPPSRETFKVCWFEQDVNDEAWQQFCHYNLYGGHPKSPHGYDIIIGSMCYPNFHYQIVAPWEIANLV
jgi:hypothetical protein